MINNHQSRRPFKPTTLDPHDILILDAVATLELSNPAAVGGVLKLLMRDFWSGRVKLYRLRRQDDAHYEWGADDIRRYCDEEDDIGSLTLDRVYSPFDRDALLTGLRFLHNAGLAGGFGPEFASLGEREAWAQAAAHDPDDYDPGRVFLRFLRIRLDELLAWASRINLNRPDPWPTKGEIQSRMTGDGCNGAGRPSAMALVEKELTRRKQAGDAWPSKAAGARELADWLKSQVSEKYWLTPKAISNKLGNQIPTGNALKN
jgi:hypothetical protein